MTKKKLIFVIVCLAALTFGVNAIEFSAGIGGDVGFIFTSIDTNIPQPYKAQLKAALDDMDTTRWGISAFFDAQYIEANLGFRFFVFSYSESGSKYEETDNFFNLGLNLKYPFKIMEVISVFPFAGFDYSIFTQGKAKYNGQSTLVDRDDLTPSNAIDCFSLDLGIGVDFLVDSNIYIRGEFNYAILFNTKSQKNTINQYESSGYNLSIFQSGPVFKLAAGYKFFE